MTRSELEHRAQQLRAELWSIESQIRAQDEKNAEEFRKMRDDWLNKQLAPVLHLQNHPYNFPVGDMPGWWKYGPTSQIGAF